MGGATIVPIYGVKGYEDRYLQHLSPEWLAMMEFAIKEAQRLGMWIDMTTGTGWPFGGPMITSDNCDVTVEYKDGELSWNFSGRNVKRAAPGGEGMAINPYSASAMKKYLKTFDNAFSTNENMALPRAMYHDSFEFLGNWSPDFLAEFRKRRGYDLQDHLPTLFNEGDDEAVARIKCDYRETLSDLHLEYLKTWVNWSDSLGCTTRNQAHGSPSNLLDLYAAAGIPETETFGASPFNIPGIRRETDNIRSDFPQPLINRMASSAAHVAGKNLVASESCTWIRNHFRTALSQVKPEIDQLFLTGINHIFFHGICYSPKDAPWPGWLFYASLEYNPRNAIWHDAKFLNEYVTRCQSILQSGTPDNNVALYWPVYDIWQSPTGMQQQLTVHHPEWLTESSCGETANWLQENGFSFDYISDRQLLAGLAEPYSIIVVPKTRTMSISTLQKLLEVEKNGKPVIFLESLPTDVPGFNQFGKRQIELKKLVKAQKLKAVQFDELSNRLVTRGVAREPMKDAGLDYIRRNGPEGNYYFIANMGATEVDGWTVMGTPFKSVAIFDPLSGKTGVASQRNKNEIYLQLKPGETRILKLFSEKVVMGEPWPVVKKSQRNPIVIQGEWQVTFIDGAPELPADFQTVNLASWTEQNDAEAKRFAGTARYAIEFELLGNNAANWILDLGDVRESARVYLNGKFIAALYSIPYTTLIGEYLIPGNNRLEIEVTNLSSNRIRDLDARKVEWQIFHDINFVNHNYTKFDASKWPLTPSGLLGPVQLIPMEELQL